MIFNHGGFPCHVPYKNEYTGDSFIETFQNYREWLEKGQALGGYKQLDKCATLEDAQAVLGLSPDDRALISKMIK